MSPDAQRSEPHIPTPVLHAIILASLAMLILAVALAGCGNDATMPDDGGVDMVTAVDMTQPPDLYPPRRDPTDHPPLFHLDHQGGPTLAAMEIWTVVWKGDEALGAQVNTFHDVMLQSDYWTARLGQYAVGHGHGMGVLVLPDAAPATIDGSKLDAMVTANVASGAWPKPNANTVFAYIVPQSTSVTNWGETGCTSFGGYHDETAHGVPFIVNLQCDGDWDSLTFVASHEAGECATDPHVSTAPGWYTNGAGEIADVCMGAPYLISGGPDGGAAEGYKVTQLYSNDDAAKGNVDPCGPTPADEPFFNVALAPSQLDLVTDQSGVGTVTTMIEPFAYGNAGTMTWEIVLNLGMGGQGITVSPSHGKGTAGDTIPVTIKTNGQQAYGPMSIAVYVQSSKGWSNTWYGTLNIQ